MASSWVLATAPIQRSPHRTVVFIEIEGTTLEYEDSELRDGYKIEAEIALGKTFGPKFGGSIGYRYQRREATDDFRARRHEDGGRSKRGVRSTPRRCVREGRLGHLRRGRPCLANTCTWTATWHPRRIRSISTTACSSLAHETLRSRKAPDSWYGEFRRNRTSSV